MSLKFGFNGNRFIATENVMFSHDGGIAIRLELDENVSPEKGELVELNSSGKLIIAENSDKIAGVFLELCEPGSSFCAVIIGGRVEILLKNTVAANVNDWLSLSDVDGRASASSTYPQDSFTIARAIETISGGTDKLVASILKLR